MTTKNPNPRPRPDEIACNNVRDAKARHRAAEREFTAANEALKAALKVLDEHLGLIDPEPASTPGSAV